MTVYTQRCNDKCERDKWRGAGLVRVDSLRHGAVFECIDGTFWKVVSVNRSGTIHCDAYVQACGQDEAADFVASAMVLVLEESE